MNTPDSLNTESKSLFN